VSVRDYIVEIGLVCVSRSDNSNVADEKNSLFMRLLLIYSFSAECYVDHVLNFLHPFIYFHLYQLAVIGTRYLFLKFNCRHFKRLVMDKAS